MTATDEERQFRVREMVREAATWASVQPWGLNTEQLREISGSHWRWRARVEARASQALATPRRRVTWAGLALILCALAITLPLALAGGKAATELRLASYSLRLPAVFHVTPYQRAMCWATTPVRPPLLPGAGGMGGVGPSVFAADASASRCVMMTFLEPSRGAVPVPVRVLADDKPVRIGRFKGLVGSTYVRGAYGFNPGGQGGPYSALPKYGTYSETIVVLTPGGPFARAARDPRDSRARVLAEGVPRHGVSGPALGQLCPRGTLDDNSVDQVTADGAGKGAQCARRHKSAPSARATCWYEYWVWRFWLPRRSNWCQARLQEPSICPGSPCKSSLFQPCIMGRSGRGRRLANTSEPGRDREDAAPRVRLLKRMG